jgi:hypothetical protein
MIEIEKFIKDKLNRLAKEKCVKARKEECEQEEEG